MSQITARLREEYFMAIVSGEKTFEGRLNKDKWANVKNGDTILFTFENDVVTQNIVRCVANVFTYDNFGDALNVHGDQLIPKHLVPAGSTAESVYLSIYSEADIKKYGVVIFELK